jgi:hypothetical protein
MHKFAFSLFLLLISLPAFAQHQTLSCVDCRDVQTYPTDFGNYAFNQLIEPLDDDFSIFTTYSTSAYVWNRQQQWALVSLADIIEDTGISVYYGFISFPVEKSSQFVRITVQDMHGKTTEYEVFETSRPLVVGDGTTPPPPTNLDPEPEDPTPAKSNAAGGGQEIICCQSGTFYWYYDQPAFSMQFGNE